MNYQNFPKKSISVASWKVRVLDYNQNDKRIFVDILSYNTSKQPFFDSQFYIEDELAQVEKIGFKALDTLKIGLELDGKDFHDKVKDFEKDTKLKRFGWKIFRVSDKEVNSNYLTNNELDEQNIVGFEKQKAIEHWILNTCDGIITAIKYWYFSNDEQREHEFSYYLNLNENDGKIDIHNLAKLSLTKHNLANFKL